MGLVGKRIVTETRGQTAYRLFLLGHGIMNLLGLVSAKARYGKVDRRYRRLNS